MKDMAIARLDATYLNQNQDIKDEIIALMVEKIVPVDKSPAPYVIWWSNQQELILGSSHLRIQSSQ